MINESPEFFQRRGWHTFKILPRQLYTDREQMKSGNIVTTMRNNSWFQRRLENSLCKGEQY